MRGFLKDEQRFGIVNDILHTEMSFREIAAKWKTSYSSVVQINRNEAYWIRYKFGNDLPSPLRPTQQDKYKEMEGYFAAGLTINEIAAKMDMPLELIYERKAKYLKKLKK